MKLSALLLLACIATSSSAQRLIKTDKHGTIKKIRNEAGQWVNAMQLASNADATVYIAKQNKYGTSDAVLLTNYGKYDAVLYVIYKTPALCLASHTDVDAAAAAKTCNTLHYARQTLSVSYMDKKAALSSRTDIADDEAAGPAVHLKSSPVGFEALPPILMTSIEKLQEIAVELYPEVAMESPVYACTQPLGIRKIGGEVKPPRPLKQPEPDYSKGAKRKRFTGETIIGLTVDVDGKPKCLHVVRLLPYGLTQKAIDAVSQYVFEPATADGKPVPVKVNVSVNFQIF